MAKSIANLSGTILNGTDVITVVITGATGGAAVLTCLVALILVIALKLYTKLVYRLAAYQVLSSLVFAIANLLNLAALGNTNGDYRFAADHTTLDVCKFVAFVRTYSAWLKLLVIVLVTFHLYCYVVCYKNFKRCELVYILVFVLVPIPVSVVPFATPSYGADGQWCWIADNSPNSELLKMTLWFGPAVLLLNIVISAVVYMVVVLFRRAYLESTDELYTSKHRLHKQIFKWSLPLLAYPVVFLILLVPSLVSQVYKEEGIYSKWVYPVNAFFSFLLSMSAGLTLIVHIFTIRCAAKRRRAKMIRLVSRSTHLP